MVDHFNLFRYYPFYVRKTFGDYKSNTGLLVLEGRNGQEAKILLKLVE
jgi:hypothetical protein